MFVLRINSHLMDPTFELQLKVSTLDLQKEGKAVKEIT